MTILREAAQRALEALDETDTFHRNLPDQRARRLVAMAALRAALAQQDEPLNLRDPAVQKRLATQWGYVPAAQAEPVEPVATLTAQRDALLEALKTADQFITNGMELGFIRMPDAATPDSAHETPGIVRAAIKAVGEGK